MNNYSKENIDKIILGIEGEKIIRQYLMDLNVHHFQVDLMAKMANYWVLIEIKNQESFKPPPFEGHGLPRWQINARLNFQNEKNIRAILFIIDRETKIIYWQYMDVLMNGEYFQTKGKNPRLVFPLENYNILKETNATTNKTRY